MTTLETTTDFGYEHALAAFVATKAHFGGGLSNHGPMASEALVSLGLERRIREFVDAYLPRLDPTEPPEPGTGYWQDQLHDLIADRSRAVATQAGHGALRLAHIARGLTRADEQGRLATIHRQELTAAGAYWRSGGPGLPGPDALAGDRTIEEWAAALPAFPDDFEYPWLLTGTLSAAAAQPGFTAAVAALRPADDPADTLDLLASAAVEVYLRNTGTAAFAAIHGVTAPTMTRQLLPYADDDTRQQLAASAAGFVAAAIVGFDTGGPAPADDRRGEDGLAEAAADTLDDHTIKFTDACVHLAARTGSRRPLTAAWHRVDETTPAAAA